MLELHVNDVPFVVGELVRIVAQPLRLSEAPASTQAIYNAAFYLPLRIDGIDRNGGPDWLELNVMDDGSQAPDYCHHTLCVLTDEVERV